MALLDLEAEFYKCVNAIIKDPPTFYRMMLLDQESKRINTLGVTNSIVIPLPLLKELFQQMEQEQILKLGTKTGRSMTGAFMDEYSLELEDIKPVKKSQLMLALATTQGWGEFKLRKLKPDKKVVIVEVVRPLEMDMPVRKGYAFTSGILGGMFSRLLHHDLVFKHYKGKGESHFFCVDGTE